MSVIITLFYSLKKNIDDPYSVTLERAIELINEKREAEKNKVIKCFDLPGGQLQVLNGRYGPYIVYDAKNFRIPKGTDAKTISKEQCEDIIKNTETKPTPKKRKKS